MTDTEHFGKLENQNPHNGFSSQCVLNSCAVSYSVKVILLLSLNMKFSMDFIRKTQ